MSMWILEPLKNQSESWKSPGNLFLKIGMNPVPGVWELSKLSGAVRDSDFFFVACLYHVDQFIFHISLPSLKFTIFIPLSYFISNNSLILFWFWSVAYLVQTFKNSNNKNSTWKLYVPFDLSYTKILSTEPCTTKQLLSSTGSSRYSIH